MEIIEQIAQQRRAVADLAISLTDDQLVVQSLCGDWLVRDVIGHLVVPLEISLPRFGIAMIAARGSFDRANTTLARQQAKRPIAELAATLRAKASNRFTPPGYGLEAPLNDLVVHSLDICRPLGIERTIPDDALLTCLTFLSTTKSFVPKGAIDGLHLVATDLDWE